MVYDCARKQLITAREMMGLHGWPLEAHLENVNEDEMRELAGESQRVPVAAVLLLAIYSIPTAPWSEGQAEQVTSD